MKRKIFITLTIIFIIILLVNLLNINNKKIKFGNNITNKTTEHIINNILNMKAYKAKIEVKIKSNKNENTYIIEQKNENGENYEQEILEPEDIKGTKIKFREQKLILENTKLNLSKIYENYPYLTENELLLNSFIKDYKTSNNTSSQETANEIILETCIENNNKYIRYKTLTIDKKTKKPTKLEIKDVTKKVLVYILYNDIEIDGF